MRIVDSKLSIFIGTALIGANSFAQESIVEIDCPGAVKAFTISEYSTDIYEDKLFHFKEKIASADANWSKLACGMSILEASKFVWLADEDIESLRKFSHLGSVYITLGERQLKFVKDKLVRARGYSAIKLGE